MKLRPDIPWSQAFLDEKLCDEPLKTIPKNNEAEKIFVPYPFRDDFYRPEKDL